MGIVKHIDRSTLPRARNVTSSHENHNGQLKMLNYFQTSKLGNNRKKMTPE